MTATPSGYRASGRLRDTALRPVEPGQVAFLRLLAGRADAGALLEVRWRHPRGMGQAWVRVGDLERAARVIEVRARSTDVYVGCVPRTHRAGGRDAVEAAWALWADVDQPDLADRLSRVAVPPSAVVRSGSGGAHLYWSLREPAAVPELEPANRRVAELLGADPSSADAARILRPPFTLNYKSSPPRRVWLEALDPRRTYALEQVVGKLPTPPLAAPAPDRRTGPRLDHGGPLRSIPPRAYFEALLGVQVPRDGKIRCPFHADRTPSLHVYPTPERGWHCFGCRRGGTIFDLGAEMWDMETSRPQFLKLRRRLAQAIRAPGGNDR